ncbi:MAG: TetR family transcriptional regulator [Subdoligranulum sp.]|mgnify:FL=1|nr:TetR family transcriptional regulator [Subdoligranulum sp.]
MPKYSVKKPFTILVAVILVLVLGVVSLLRIQTDLLPSMNLPYLLVMTTYPGASPEQVEADVTQPLADAAGIGKGTVYEYFSSKEEILQGVARYCFAQENERIAARFDRCRTLVDLENELVDYLQEVAAQRMSTYRLLAVSFGQQAALPECTDACRSQLTALTDVLVARLQVAGEIDPGLTMDACRTSIFCTVTGGLIALCCSAGSGTSLPALPQNLREALHRSLQAPK